MLDKFSKAFEGVEKVYVAEIYPAGKEPIEGVVNAVIEAVRENSNIEVDALPCFENAHHLVGGF